MNTYQVHNSRALLQEVWNAARCDGKYVSCGKLDKGLGKPSSAIKYYNQALEMYVR